MLRACLGPLLAIALVAGCASSRPTSDDLARTLPTEVGGIVTSITTPSADMQSGLLTDGALGALGKSRASSSIAVAVASPDLVVLAMAVDGADGPTLVDALVQTWPPGGEAESVTIGDISVLRRQAVADVYFYVQGDAAYVVETADPDLADEVIRQLP